MTFLEKLVRLPLGTCEGVFSASWGISLVSRVTALLTSFGASKPICFIRPGKVERLTRGGGVLCLGLAGSPSSTNCLAGAGGVPSCLGFVFGEESIIGN